MLGRQRSLAHEKTGGCDVWKSSEGDAVFDTGEREHLREREELGGAIGRGAFEVCAEREEFRAETEKLEGEQE